MKNIVTLLRELANHKHSDFTIANEAADEIIKLQKWNQEMVELQAKNKLDGYRELAQKLANQENYNDYLKLYITQLQNILNDVLQLLPVDKQMSVKKILENSPKL